VATVRCSVVECRHHDGVEGCRKAVVRIGVQFTTLTDEFVVNGLSTGYPGKPFRTTVCEDFEEGR
jgi:hypothetical protein